MNQYLLFLFLSISLSAQVVTDGTVGSVVTLDGADVTITQDLGTTSGNNLFHSFKTFDIDSGNKVTFTGSDTLENVISRVTGGEISTLDGTLKSNIANANFYFFNPAGILLGPNASIDVPASLHISTADYLTLEDGDIFSATNPNESTLGIAKPEAFGYLDREATSLVLDGTQLLLSAQDLELSGNDIEINNFALVETLEGGDITIYAKDNFNILNGSLVVSITNTEFDAGDIDVEAKNILFNANDSEDFSGLRSYAYLYSTGDAGSIDIKADKFELLNGSRIGSGTWSSGSTGDINIDVIDLTFDSMDSTLAYTTGIEFNNVSTTFFTSLEDGTAGKVNIYVDNLFKMLGDSTIITSNRSTTQSGDIEIKAKNMIIDTRNLSDFGGISSSSLGSNNTNTDGDAGTVTVEVSETLELYSGGQISSDTYYSGDAGKVDIKAKNIIIDDMGASAKTGITSITHYTSGNAGLINVDVENFLEIYNGGEITSSTNASGDAGVVNVNAKDILLDGQDSLSLTGISSSSPNVVFFGGDAGVVNVNVQNSLNIFSGAQISSSTSSAGIAGQVNVQAKNITIDAKAFTDLDTGILSSSNYYFNGKAGEINIEVDGLLEVLDGGKVSSTTASDFGAGEINIKANSIHLNGEESYEFTGITSSSILGLSPESTKGDAGKINIDVSGLIEIYIDAQIASLTDTDGDAGEINIKAGSMKIDGKYSAGWTKITSTTGYESIGDAGVINIEIDGLLELYEGAVITTETSFSGDAGDINIKAGDIYIDAVNWWEITGIESNVGFDSTGAVGNIYIDTNNIDILNNGGITIFNFGNALIDSLENFKYGKISINANNITLSDFSHISAESFFDVPASSIEINSNFINLNSESEITTAAFENDGGLITINNSASMILNNGLITTSTEGGDGGDININTAVLLMDTGFIQANTDLGSSGGNIAISTDSIITKKSISPQIGGEKEEFVLDSGKNIIQAAAPQGNPGDLNIISPKLDLTSSLAKLSTKYVNISELIKDTCSVDLNNKSSLIIH